jgi:hypothetical protein
MNEEQLPFLDFNRNWNNKLFCDLFTTIRLSNEKYQVGKKFQTRLVHNSKNRPPDVLQKVEIIDIKPLLLSQISDWIAYLDTGHNAEYTREILKRMYSHKVQNIDYHVFSYILLKAYK